MHTNCEWNLIYVNCMTGMPQPNMHDENKKKKNKNEYETSTIGRSPLVELKIIKYTNYVTF